jgi:DNA-directed RNA polymerase
MLPAPRPLDSKSDANSYWFVDSPTQELLAVMDACLHGLFDVERAKGIFDRMRQKVGNPALETRIYNAFLEAYLGMSTMPETQDKGYWVDSLWELYGVMESGEEKVRPSASTYAIALLSWYRYVFLSNTHGRHR